MLYSGNNPVDCERAKRRLDSLIGKECVFELTERKLKRTVSQNAYLHLLLGYFASETGNRLEYVKVNYFKRLCNAYLFLYMKKDKYLGEVECVRSCTELDSAQMTEAIQRFRNWSSSQGGIYLPEPHEKEFLQAIEVELNRNREYL